jgi:predicted nucleic-acid-binding protein
MIGFDTNVILRALLGDDPVRSPIAQKKLAGLSSAEQGYVSAGVLLELYWVLNRYYRMPRAVIGRTIQRLLEVEWLIFEDFASLALALQTYEGRNVDFSDAFIAERNMERGCKRTVTFDSDASKRVPGMELHP